MAKKTKSFKPSRIEDLESSSEKSIDQLKTELEELKDKKRDIEMEIFDETDVTDSILFILDQLDSGIDHIEDEISKLENPN